jgi:hypothetical protein
MSDRPFKKTTRPKATLSSLDPMLLTTHARIPKDVIDSGKRDQIEAQVMGDKLKELCYDAADQYRFVSGSVQAETTNGRRLSPEHVEPDDEVIHHLVELGMAVGTVRSENKSDPLSLARDIVDEWRQNVGRRISAPEQNELVARIADALAVAMGFDEGYEPTTDINYGQDP